MENKTLPEYWLRGPVEGIVPLLQPVAHALLQAQDEINEMMQDFPDTKLWQDVAGKASVGFHLMHIAGVQDRLLSYAKAQQLSELQMTYLRSEGKETPGTDKSHLLDVLNRQFDATLQTLGRFGTEEMTAFRGVGRKSLPSTVLGLLFHLAEHTMRHTGQLLVTQAVLRQEII